MSKLGMPIPDYNSLQDPIFVHATRLHPVETHTYSTAALDPPDEPGEGNNKRSSEQPVDNESSKKLCVDSTISDKVTVKTEPIDSEELPAEEKKLTSDSDATCASSEKSEEPSVLKSDNTEVSSKEKEVSHESKSSNDIQKDEDYVREKEEQKCEKNGLSEKNEKADNERVASNVKEEFDTGSASSDKVNEQNPDDSSKSPVKGIWRPFSFEDTVSSSSSSCVTINLSVKPEPGLQLNSNPLPLQQPFKSSEFLNCSILNSKPLLQNQNLVKKCHIQLEPLDLSNKLESIKENPFFCQYCRSNYHSMFCLFYRRQSSTVPPDPACYCCDEEDEKDLSSPDADVKSADDSDKSTNKVPITNPGWFGKGYRKKIRKKR